MDASTTTKAITAVAALVLCACSSQGTARQPLLLPSSTWSATGATGDQAILIRTPSGKSVTLADAAEELADADVVFLGEQHDNAAGHAVQLALTMALAERHGSILLSMEMLERDAQPRVDLYLKGAIDEAQFKEHTRLWPNYDEHYRAAVEFCREHGYPVLAANVYRPIASRVAKEGLSAAAGDVWAARSVHAPEGGEYRRRFNEVMGSHGDAGSDQLSRIFAAQCIKDDTMAESIADALRQASTREGNAPQVIHWNGRFHSDFGLGTVERLKRRMPGLNIAVVSMLEVERFGAEIADDELNQGHFIVLVKPMP